MRVFREPEHYVDVFTLNPCYLVWFVDMQQARKEAQEEAMANELRKARVAYHNEKQR